MPDPAPRILAESQWFLDLSPMIDALRFQAADFEYSHGHRRHLRMLRAADPKGPSTAAVRGVRRMARRLLAAAASEPRVRIALPEPGAVDPIFPATSEWRGDDSAVWATPLRCRRAKRHRSFPAPLRDRIGHAPSKSRCPPQRRSLRNAAAFSSAKQAGWVERISVRGAPRGAATEANAL
jgi:hypothetical protein